MGGITDFLFGSKGKIDWDELHKMIKLQAETNRTDRQGIFTGWEWDDAKQKQMQTIDPKFQGAVDRLGFNAGKPADPYNSPSQFNQMLDAKMKNQMERQGLDTSGYAQQAAPGQTDPGAFPPSQNVPGRIASSFLPPPPAETPLGEQRPGNQQPPGERPPGDNVGGGRGGPGGKGENNQLHQMQIMRGLL